MKAEEIQVLRVLTKRTVCNGIQPFVSFLMHNSRLFVNVTLLSEPFLLFYLRNYYVVKKELWHLDIERLKILYREEEKQLETKLLNGASWEEVIEERKRMGELYTLIYKKSNPEQFGNPAENASRKALD